MQHETNTFGEDGGTGANATRSPAASGMTSEGRHGSTGLLCLAATDRDRREIAAILGSTSAGTPANGGSATDSVGLESLAAVASARRAVLAGPDAVAAIVQGRTAPGAAGGGPGGAVIDVMTIGGRGTPGAAAGPLTDGLMMGSSRRRSDTTGHRIPTGPLADTATDQDHVVLAGLTPREAEVAELVGNGSNVGEIARILGREKTTVISHRRSLLRKIGCRDALGIARFAYRTGLARP